MSNLERAGAEPKDDDEEREVIVSKTKIDRALVADCLRLLVVVVMVGGILTGCSQSATNQPAAGRPTGFERDLQFIRNGQFAHVWVFSRKDGNPVDKDDAAFLRTNAPQVVDWVTTDDKKRVIAGTNFDLEQGNLPQLRERFVVEDYTGR